MKKLGYMLCCHSIDFGLSGSFGYYYITPNQFYILSLIASLVFDKNPAA